MDTGIKTVSLNRSRGEVSSGQWYAACETAVRMPPRRLHEACLVCVRRYARFYRRILSSGGQPSESKTLQKPVTKLEMRTAGAFPRDIGSSIVHFGLLVVRRADTPRPNNHFGA